MRYLTGLWAVNLPETDTACDWHGAAYDWDNPPMADSSRSVFGDWGIENRTYTLGGKPRQWPVATHVRACLDMLEQGHVGDAQGMREYFIGNEKYTPLLLKKALLLQGTQHWDAASRLLGDEYGTLWLNACRQETPSSTPRLKPGA